MGLGDDQEMGGRLGVDVVKGVHQLVLVNLVGGDLPAAIFAKRQSLMLYPPFPRGFDSSIAHRKRNVIPLRWKNRGPRMLPRPPFVRSTGDKLIPLRAVPVSRWRPASG